MADCELHIIGLTITILIIGLTITIHIIGLTITIHIIGLTITSIRVYIMLVYFVIREISTLYNDRVLICIDH